MPRTRLPRCVAPCCVAGARSPNCAGVSPGFVRLASFPILRTVIAEHGADPVIREALSAQKSESEQALLSLLALRRSA
jgi:hypothetical protein